VVVSANGALTDFQTECLSKTPWEVACGRMVKRPVVWDAEYGIF
jgi:hypothetical protein